VMMKNFSEPKQECGWVCRQRTESMTYCWLLNIGKSQCSLIIRRQNVQNFIFTTEIL